MNQGRRRRSTRAAAGSRSGGRPRVPQTRAPSIPGPRPSWYLTLTSSPVTTAPDPHRRAEKPSIQATRAPLNPAVNQGRRRRSTRAAAAAGGGSCCGEGSRPRVPVPGLEDGATVPYKECLPAVHERPPFFSLHPPSEAIKDSPPFERLSLSDNTLFSPQPAEEIDNYYDYYDEGRGDVGRRIWDPVPTKGLTMSMLDSLGDSIITLSDMDQPRPESDVDSEEFLREVQEYLDAFPSDTLSDTFDRLVEIEHAKLTALAAEWGTEPPSPPRLRRDQKPQSVQVAEQASSVAAHTGHGVVPTESRPEASMEEIIRNGKTWMNKEVMLCFEKHVKRSAHLMGLEYCLDELLHQCFNVESYNKVYHHYNFTVKMKMPSSDDWVVELYFAEVKEMFGTKYYFCCPLEPDEDGCCYACRSQGVEDLKHPAIGGFSQGSAEAPGFGLCYEDD